MADSANVCDICHRTFSSKHNLRSHRNVVHFNHRPHRCGVCGRCFARHDRLKRHLQTQHGIHEGTSRTTRRRAVSVLSDDDEAVMVASAATSTSGSPASDFSPPRRDVEHPLKSIQATANPMLFEHPLPVERGYHAARFLSSVAEPRATAPAFLQHGSNPSAYGWAQAPPQPSQFHGFNVQAGAVSLVPSTCGACGAWFETPHEAMDHFVGFHGWNPFQHAPFPGTGAPPPHHHHHRPPPTRTNSTATVPSEGMLSPTEKTASPSAASGLLALASVVSSEAPPPPPAPRTEWSGPAVSTGGQVVRANHRAMGVSSLPGTAVASRHAPNPASMAGLHQHPAQHLYEQQQQTQKQQMPSPPRVSVPQLIATSPMGRTHQAGPVAETSTAWPVGEHASQQPRTPFAVLRGLSSPAPGTASLTARGRVPPPPMTQAAWLGMPSSSSSSSRSSSSSSNWYPAKPPHPATFPQTIPSAAPREHAHYKPGIVST